MTKRERATARLIRTWRLGKIAARVEAEAKIREVVGELQSDGENVTRRQRRKVREAAMREAGLHR